MQFSETLTAPCDCCGAPRPQSYISGPKSKVSRFDYSVSIQSSRFALSSRIRSMLDSSSVSPRPSSCKQLQWRRARPYPATHEWSQRTLPQSPSNCWHCLAWGAQPGSCVAEPPLQARLGWLRSSLRTWPGMSGLDPTDTRYFSPLSQRCSL